MATRDRIRARAHERKPVRVEVPDWDGPVWVRVMPSGEVLNITDPDTPQRELIYRLLIDCLVEEDGTPIFSEADREFLEAEPFPVILGLFKDAAKINGLPAGELEAAMEDLEPTPDAASSTG